MPMREECVNFESRTYRNGETVRKCDLDLAPEAPWRCPADCARFEPRLADVNWARRPLHSGRGRARQVTPRAAELAFLAAPALRGRCASAPPGRYRRKDRH